MAPIFRLRQLIGHVGQDLEQRDEHDIERNSLHCRRFWRVAEEIFQSNPKYMQKIGIVESVDQHLAVRGICIQESHPDQKYNPWWKIYTVQIVFIMYTNL